jgi:ATP-dependent protease ClpP protease subunit
VAAPATPATPPTYVSFVAPITHQSAQVLLAAFAELVKQQVKSAYLLFSTNGGQVMEGVALYTALRAFPFTLTTHNIGNVDSVGNIIFLAGGRRYASPAATFLFHGVVFPVTGLTQLEEKLLVERLDSIRADHKRLSSIIAARTSLTLQEAQDLFVQQATKDATYAKSKGIINDIADANVPAGAPYFHLNVV